MSIGTIVVVVILLALGVAFFEQRRQIATVWRTGVSDTFQCRSVVLQVKGWLVALVISVPPVTLVEWMMGR